MSDDESIFPNHSVSQINDNDDAFTDLSRPLSENMSNNQKLKSIGAYLIAQNDPACLLEIKKYLDKGSQVFVVNILY